MGMNPTLALLALAEQGHEVIGAQEGDDDYDVYVGPRLWRYLPDVSDKFMALLLKEVRAKQPPKSKKVKVKSGTTAS